MFLNSCAQRSFRSSDVYTLSHNYTVPCVQDVGLQCVLINVWGLCWKCFTCTGIVILYALLLFFTSPHPLLYDNNEHAHEMGASEQTLMVERDCSGSPHIDLRKSQRHFCSDSPRFLVFLLSHAKWRKEITLAACLPRCLNAQGACFRHTRMCRNILSKVTFIFFYPHLKTECYELLAVYRMTVLMLDQD